VVLSQQQHVIFIRDFERICRGETTFEQAGLVLGIQPEAMCYDLGFEHGRICVATLQGFYIFTFRTDLSTKAAFVRPFNPLNMRFPWRCIQLTDHRIYFTWEYSRRRLDIPLFEDEENIQELPPPITPIVDTDFDRLIWLRHLNSTSNMVGYIDFTMMPEGFASEIWI